MEEEIWGACSRVITPVARTPTQCLALPTRSIDYPCPPSPPLPKYREYHRHCIALVRLPESSSSIKHLIRLVSTCTATLEPLRHLNTVPGFFFFLIPSMFIAHIFILHRSSASYLIPKLLAHYPLTPTLAPSRSTHRQLCAPLVNPPPPSLSLPLEGCEACRHL